MKLGHSNKGLKNTTKGCSLSCYFFAKGSLNQYFSFHCMLFFKSWSPQQIYHGNVVLHLGHNPKIVTPYGREKKSAKARQKTRVLLHVNKTPLERLSKWSHTYAITCLMTGQSQKCSIIKLHLLITFMKKFTGFAGNSSILQTFLTATLLCSTVTLTTQLRPLHKARTYVPRTSGSYPIVQRRQPNQQPLATQYCGTTYTFKSPV